MAYTTIDENTLYIHGGIDYSDQNTTTSSAKSKQFFALDLTLPSWNTSAPPWRQINVDGDSGPGAYVHSFSVSPDRRTLTVWDPVLNGTIMNYSLDTKAWTRVSARPAEYTTYGWGVQAASDPTTGFVYTPSGFSNSNNDMFVYDLSAKTATPAPMPPKDGFQLKWYAYSFVWSEVRRSFLIFGGEGNFGPYFYEYNPSGSNWTEIPMTGDTPPRLKNACLIPAYNDTKMVLFGGLLYNGTVVGTLYTLDVASLTWTQGTSADPIQNRAGMACSVSGDNFIIWGGLRNTLQGGVAVSDTPVIYNMNTSKWTNQFVRGTGSQPTNTPTQPADPTVTGGPSIPKDMEDKEGNVGAAITVGTLVISAVGFLIYKRRRRQKSLADQRHQVIQMPGVDLSLATIRDSENNSQDHGPSPSSGGDGTVSSGHTLPPPYTSSPSSSPLAPFQKPLTTQPSTEEESKLEELQYQVAIRQEELVRRSVHPQYNPAYAVDQTRRVARNPQGTGEIDLEGSSSSSSITDEELLQQTQELQAEINRLQARNGS
ncbi:hypothetical protein BGX33_008923 [Mortierella sp. NVP41]|nr:hypothetical protein BGX33_008923 [Mortierella sp. NVP41]